MKTNDTIKADNIRNSFSQWQDFAQAYAGFVGDATEQTLKASLTARERAGKLLGETFKQTQTLAAAEQEIILNAAETWQAQAQLANKRIARLFQAPPAN
jgi:hypothetical protein